MKYKSRSRNSTTGSLLEILSLYTSIWLLKGISVVDGKVPASGEGWYPDFPESTETSIDEKYYPYPTSTSHPEAVETNVDFSGLESSTLYHMPIEAYTDLPVSVNSDSPIFSPSESPVYYTDRPIYYTDSPVYYTNSPIHSSSASPIYYTDSPVYYTDPPVYYTSSPTHSSSESPVSYTESSTDSYSELPISYTESPQTSYSESPVESYSDSPIYSSSDLPPDSYSYSSIYSSSMPVNTSYNSSINSYTDSPASETTIYTSAPAYSSSSIYASTESPSYSDKPSTSAEVTYPENQNTPSYEETTLPSSSLLQQLYTTVSPNAYKPTPPPKGKPGKYPDPQDMKKYFLWKFINNRWQLWRLTCPAGKTFRPVTRNCM